MYDCQGYRLPTVAEWEYAAKADTTTNTYNGDVTTDNAEGCVEDPVLNDIAWYCWNTSQSSDGWQPEYIREVGLKQPNPWGLYDMLGNAMEWTDSVCVGWPLNYPNQWNGETLVDPMGPTEDDDSRRYARGGNYFFSACYDRSSFPSGDSCDNRGPGYGFRPVRTLPAPAPDAGSDAGDASR